MIESILLIIIQSGFKVETTFQFRVLWALLSLWGPFKLNDETTPHLYQL